MQTFIRHFTRAFLTDGSGIPTEVDFKDGGGASLLTGTATVITEPTVAVSPNPIEIPADTMPGSVLAVITATGNPAPQISLSGPAGIRLSGSQIVYDAVLDPDSYVVRVSVDSIGGSDFVDVQLTVRDLSLERAAGTVTRFEAWSGPATPQAEGFVAGEIFCTGGRFVDAQGRVALLRGANWIGGESAAGVPFGLEVCPIEHLCDMYAFDAGFNFCRLPIAANHLRRGVPSSGVYLLANPWAYQLTIPQILDRLIAELTARGVQICIDLHRSLPATAGDTGTDDDRMVWIDGPTGYAEAAYLDDIEAIGAHFGAIPGVIMVDLANEPSGTTVHWGDPAKNTLHDWRRIGGLAANRLHSVAPHLVAIVQGVEYDRLGGRHWWGSNYTDMTPGNEPVITRGDKWAVGPHEYPPFLTASPAFWSSNLRTEAAHIAVMDTRWRHAVTRGIPALIGETGSKMQADQDILHAAALASVIESDDMALARWAWCGSSADSGVLLTPVDYRIPDASDWGNLRRMWDWATQFPTTRFVDGSAQPGWVLYEVELRSTQAANPTNNALFVVEAASGGSLTTEQFSLLSRTIMLPATKTVTRLRLLVDPAAVSGPSPVTARIRLGFSQISGGVPQAPVPNGYLDLVLRRADAPVTELPGGSLPDIAPTISVTPSSITVPASAQPGDVIATVVATGRPVPEVTVSVPWLSVVGTDITLVSLPASGTYDGIEVVAESRAGDDLAVIQVVAEAAQVNRPPTGGGVVLTNAIVGQSYTIDVSEYFSDPDEDDLVFTQQGAWPGAALATVSISDGLLSFSPLAAQTFNIIVRATDGGGLFASRTFRFLAEDAPTAPDIISVSTVAALTSALNDLAAAGTQNQKIELAAGNHGNLTWAGTAPIGTVISGVPMSGDVWPTKLGAANFNGSNGLTVENMEFRHATTNPVSANNSTGLTLRRCHMTGTAYDPETIKTVQGDNFANPLYCISIATTAANFVMEECLLEWCKDGINPVGLTGNWRIVCNEIRYTHQDGIKQHPSVAGSMGVVAFNLIHLFVPNGGAHNDAVQFQQDGGGTDIFNVHYIGNVTRQQTGAAGTYIQSLFRSGSQAADGGVRNSSFVGNLLVGDHSHGLTMERGGGLLVANNTVINSVLPAVPNISGHTFANTITVLTASQSSGEAGQVTRNITEGLTVGAGVSTSDNVVLGKGGSIISYAATFPGWSGNTRALSWAGFLAAYQPAAATYGAHAVVNFGTPRVLSEWSFLGGVFGLEHLGLGDDGEPAPGTYMPYAVPAGLVSAYGKGEEINITTVQQSTGVYWSNHEDYAGGDWIGALPPVAEGNGTSVQIAYLRNNTNSPRLFNADAPGADYAVWQAGFAGAWRVMSESPLRLAIVAEAGAEPIQLFDFVENGVNNGKFRASRWNNAISARNAAFPGVSWDGAANAWWPSGEPGRVTYGIGANDTIQHSALKAFLLGLQPNGDAVQVGIPVSFTGLNTGASKTLTFQHAFWSDLGVRRILNLSPGDPGVLHDQVLAANRLDPAYIPRNGAVHPAVMDVLGGGHPEPDEYFGGYFAGAQEGISLAQKLGVTEIWPVDLTVELTATEALIYATDGRPLTTQARVLGWTNSQTSAAITAAQAVKSDMTNLGANVLVGLLRWSGTSSAAPAYSHIDAQGRIVLGAPAGVTLTVAARPVLTGTKDHPGIAPGIDLGLAAPMVLAPAKMASATIVDNIGGGGVIPPDPDPDIFLGDPFSGTDIAFSAAAAGFGQHLSRGFATLTDPNFLPGTAWSVECFVTIDAAPGAERRFFQQLDRFRMAVTADGRISASLKPSSGSQMAQVGDPATNPIIADGARHHIAITSNGSLSQLCVDGVQIAQLSRALTTGTPGEVSIRWHDASTITEARVDEIAVWTVNRRNGSIYPVPAAPYSGNEASLHRLYHLDGTLLSPGVA